MNITGTTQVIGLIGNPVEHSISPLLHNLLSMKLQKDVVYVAHRVKEQDLSEAISGIRAFNIVGMNVTVPHKVAVMPLLDEVEAEAQLLGAVNTIINKDGKLIGTNTDALGFYQQLIQIENSIEDKTVLLLGAGGAARVIALDLAKRGIKKIILWNRSVGKIADLKKQIEENSDVGVEVYSPECKYSVDIVIQGTPVGMHPNVNDVPISFNELIDTQSSKPNVYDLIYNPIETAFMREAKEAGCETYNGFEMLMNQGILAYEKWFNITIEKPIREEVINELKQIYYNK